MDGPAFIRSLIKKAGGAEAVAKASASAERKVGVEAIQKWPRNGVPEDRWPLVVQLTGAKVVDIHKANEAVRRRKRERTSPVVSDCEQAGSKQYEAA